MLGRTIADPDGIEGAPGTSAGLGLLEVDTVLGPIKELRVERATHVASGTEVAGYHMHMGVTSGVDCDRPFARIGDRNDGALSADGRVAGTYMHGIFASDPFRHAFLNVSSELRHERVIEGALDGLARHLEQHLDLDGLLALSWEVR